jgi:hypothetical protein
MNLERIQRTFEDWNTVKMNHKRFRVWAVERDVSMDLLAERNYSEYLIDVEEIIE